MSKTQTYPQYYVSQNNLMLLFGLTVLLCQCTQRYVSPYVSPHTGYLVVEGYISGNSLTQYTLSRTIPLPGDSTIPVVTGASVHVEGDDNSVYPLVEQGNGVYADNLNLNPGLQYRLRIKTPNGESYLSDFVPFKPTPPIDSVNWTADASGLNLFVNTHDPANSTHYYQWAYFQTWEYYSADKSYLIYNSDSNTVVARTAAQQDYQCWKELDYSSILIASSASLAQDEIYRFPLTQIPLNSQQLSVLYSILVKQYALTADGYNFLSLMRKNTESLGSIFDVLPSQLVGNIHSLTNPNEPVIGYISAGTVQQQRVFLSAAQFPFWDYIYQCPGPNITVPNNPNSFLFYFGRADYDPISTAPQPGGNYTANSKYCLNCTLQGGTTQKPVFWPN